MQDNYLQSRVRYLRFLHCAFYTEFILKILSRTKGLFPVQVLQEKALSDLVFCLTKKEGFIKSAQSIVVKRFDSFLKFERKF